MMSLSLHLICPFTSSTQQLFPGDNCDIQLKPNQYARSHEKIFLLFRSTGNF